MESNAEVTIRFEISNIRTAVSRRGVCLCTELKAVKTDRV